jgi:hypothetical protein
MWRLSSGVTLERPRSAAEPPDYDSLRFFKYY